MGGLFATSGSLVALSERFTILVNVDPILEKIKASNLESDCLSNGNH